MEAGWAYMWGGLGKRYLAFLSLINVKNNGALVAHQPHSTWFWFTAWGEGTACSKLVPADEPPPCFTTSRRLLCPQHPSPRPRAIHIKETQFYTISVLKINKIYLQRPRTNIWIVICNPMRCTWICSCYLNHVFIYLQKRGTHFKWEILLKPLNQKATKQPFIYNKWIICFSFHWFNNHGVDLSFAN